MIAHLNEKKIATRLRSMTGFAQTVIQENGFVLRVNLRSVNHRSLDLHLNLPEQLQSAEPAVRKEIAAKAPRGHLQLKVSLERGPDAGPAINESLIGRYIELFQGVAQRHGLTLETAVRTLSQLPGVVSFPESSSRDLSPRVEAAFLKALHDTVESWDGMRATEGSILEDDLRNRTLHLSGSMQRMEQLRTEVLPVAQMKLRERLQASLQQTGIDATRIAQEAAILAEHTDITEEILRLKAHFSQFLELLDGKPDVGKKLDFLLQEIQRELNTLMAKTAGLGESGLSMTQTALDIKGEVEKLREQVQNVQ